MRHSPRTSIRVGCWVGAACPGGWRVWVLGEADMRARGGHVRHARELAACGDEVLCRCSVHEAAPGRATSRARSLDVGPVRGWQRTRSRSPQAGTGVPIQGTRCRSPQAGAEVPTAVRPVDQLPPRRLLPANSREVSGAFIAEGGGELGTPWLPSGPTPNASESADRARTCPKARLDASPLVYR
jgi:hypothetical protein